MDTTPLPQGPRSACIVLAHGSRNSDAIREHLGLCEQIASLTPTVLVLPAFLELGSPTLDDAVQTAVATGVTEISVLPQFLSAGNHVQVDIPQQVTELQEQHPALSISVLAHLGSYDALAELMSALVLHSAPMD